MYISGIIDTKDRLIIGFIPSECFLDFSRWWISSRDDDGTIVTFRTFDMSVSNEIVTQNQQMEKGSAQTSS